MKVRIRSDSVIVEGYVNAIERNSKPLASRIGRFIERICKGAFSAAIERNNDIHVLLNHDWARDLGSTRNGNLDLCEDNIGLYARAEINDPEVVQIAKNGGLVGWSFGFTDTENGVERGIDDETGLPLRRVRDLNLEEVSILDKRRSPAYEGTLIQARAENDIVYHSDMFADSVVVESVETETRGENEAVKQEGHPDTDKVNVDYSVYETMIAEMKGE